ncbi:MAG: hypothetical protein AAF576_10515, partial [Pseudomonadota bacterium]
ALRGSGENCPPSGQDCNKSSVRIFVNGKEGSAVCIGPKYEMPQILAIRDVGSSDVVNGTIVSCCDPRRSCSVDCVENSVAVGLAPRLFMIGNCTKQIIEACAAILYAQACASVIICAPRGSFANPRQSATGEITGVNVFPAALNEISNFFDCSLLATSAKSKAKHAQQKCCP